MNNKPKKLCTHCGNYPATLPDRNIQGRPIKRICENCYRVNLSNDFISVLKSHFRRSHEELESWRNEILPNIVTPMEDDNNV